MNNNIFLELKESDATSNKGSGSWVTTLQEKITIEENDEIILSKSMIDTNTINEQDINIFSPTTLQLEFMYYTTKQDQANKSFDTPAYKAEYNADPTNTTHNGQNFLALRKTDTSGGDVERMVNIKMSQHTFLPGGAVGDFPLRISFTDPGGVAQSTIVNLPNKKAYHKGETFTVAVTIVFDRTQNVSFTKLDDTGGKNTKIEVGDIIPENDELYTPVFGKHNIELTPGNYSPNQICKVINRSLQEARITRDPQSVESSILIQSDQILTDGYSYYNLIDEGNPLDRVIPPPDSLQRFFRQDNTENYWIGASQFELSFDEDSRRFFWNYLHTPAFDDDGAEAILYSQEFAISKSGGVLFRSLSAFDESDTTVDFWSGQLGFNLNELEVPIYNTILRNQADDADVGNMSFVYAVDKENMTSGFSSADSAVGKKSDGVIVPQTWIVPKPVAATPSTFQSSIENTIQIQATEPFENRQFAFSHFLVSIGAGFSNNMITPQNNLD